MPASKNQNMKIHDPAFHDVQCCSDWLDQLVGAGE